MACVPGTFRSNASEYICEACPAGSYHDVDVYASTNVESCLSCPADTTSAAGSGSNGSVSVDDCVCAEGFFKDVSAADYIQQRPRAVGMSNMHGECKFAGRERRQHRLRVRGGLLRPRRRAVRAVPSGQLLRGWTRPAPDVPAAQHFGGRGEQRGRVRLCAWLRFRDRKWGVCKVQRRELLSWGFGGCGVRSELHKFGGSSGSQCVHMPPWPLARVHAGGGRGRGGQQQRPV